MVDTELFAKSVNAEKIDLAKLGWTECRDDKLILSYIRGYIWRNYRIRIKPPLDWVIFCMLDDCLSECQRDCKKDLSTFTKGKRNIIANKRDSNESPKKS